jgi:hypothetical protein
LSRVGLARVRHGRQQPARRDDAAAPALARASPVECADTFVVTNTDTDPSARYTLARGEFESGVEIAPPALPGLRLFVNHRQERRDGTRQSVTTSHCPTCHVESYSRGVDELARDWSSGARLGLSHVTLEYSFSDRRFSDRTPVLTNVYDLAVHPATLADVFLNRVQYDRRAGALPFDVTPASNKQSHVFKARVSLPGDASASGTVTRSEVTNQDTAVGYTYTGGTGRFTVPIGGKVVRRGNVRRYDIRADDVFVDIVEQISPAGTTAGLTYAQAYPTFGDPDYVRRSDLARTPTDAALDLTWTPLKRTSLQAGVAWQEVRRTSFEVEDSRTSMLILRAQTRPWKPLQSRTRFEYAWATDPFANVNAAVPAVLQPYASPNNVPFTGLQYYEMYGSRQGTLTAFPTRTTRFEQSLAWSASPRFSVNGHYRVRSSSNDHLTFSTWSRTADSFGGEAWIAPGDRWSLTAGHTTSRERLDTLFSTLAFVG